MDQAFTDTTYIIDLSYTKTSAEIVYDLSSILDNDNSKNKKIFLKLGSVDLNKSQLLSLKSLVMSVNSVLAILETDSVQTEAAASSIGIIIANKFTDDNAAKVEDQKEYVSVNDIESIIQEPQQSEEIQEVETVDQPEQANVPDEEVNEELDNIFDAEKKLEAILGQEPETKNELEQMILESEEYTEKDYEIDTMPTMYIKQNIRSGQVVNYDGNVIIVGDCNPGCEINATGDITIWGILGGIAHAGSSGNVKARIRALKLNAIQLRIANCIARRPDSINLEINEKTNTFVPEEARIINDNIVIFKMND